MNLELLINWYKKMVILKHMINKDIVFIHGLEMV